MTCVHLRKLYDLCAEHDLKLSSAELVHVICPQCGKKEVCPSMLMEEVEWDEGHPRAETSVTAPSTPVHPRS